VTLKIKSDRIWLISEHLLRFSDHCGAWSLLWLSLLWQSSKAVRNGDV
jgi:hypothetical protein